MQVDPHAQKEAERRVETAAASVDEITHAHAKLQTRMREIEGGAERMRGEQRTVSAQVAALERQRGELAATVRVWPRLLRTLLESMSRFQCMYRTAAFLVLLMQVPASQYVGLFKQKRLAGCSEKHI